MAPAVQTSIAALQRGFESLRDDGCFISAATIRSDAPDEKYHGGGAPPFRGGSVRIFADAEVEDDHGQPGALTSRYLLLRRASAKRWAIKQPDQVQCILPWSQPADRLWSLSADAARVVSQLDLPASFGIPLARGSRKYDLSDWLRVLFALGWQNPLIECEKLVWSGPSTLPVKVFNATNWGKRPAPQPGEQRDEAGVIDRFLAVTFGHLPWPAREWFSELEIIGASIQVLGWLATTEGRTRTRLPAGRPRGRRPDTDPLADQLIAQRWGTGRYRRYRDLALELELSEKTVKHAVDRCRHRKSSRKRLGPPSE